MLGDSMLEVVGRLGMRRMDSLAVIRRARTETTEPHLLSNQGFIFIKYYEKMRKLGLSWRLHQEFVHG